MYKVFGVRGISQPAALVISQCTGHGIQGQGRLLAPFLIHLLHCMTSLAVRPRSRLPLPWCSLVPRSATTLTMPSCVFPALPHASFLLDLPPQLHTATSSRAETGFFSPDIISKAQCFCSILNITTNYYQGHELLLTHITYGLQTSGTVSFVYSTPSLSPGSFSF